MLTGLRFSGCLCVDLVSLRGRFGWFVWTGGGFGAVAECFGLFLWVDW